MMRAMAKRVIEAVVATTHPLPAYGGVQIDDSVMDGFAEDLRAGRIPMFVQHDLRRPIDAKILESAVRPTADGYKDVWIRFEVDADQWDEFDRERKAAGAPGGFSFSCAEPLTVLDGLPSASLEAIDLAADASHWTDDELLAAAEELRRIATVRVARRYEFAVEPAAVVVVAIILSQVGLGVLGNAVYDGLKRFLFGKKNDNAAARTPRPPTIFHFRVERPEGAVEARLETDDPEALHRAIDSFDQLTAPRQLSVWDDELQVWSGHGSHAGGPWFDPRCGAPLGAPSRFSREDGQEGEPVTTDLRFG
jgi:hypothetical protein